MRVILSPESEKRLKKLSKISQVIIAEKLKRFQSGSEINNEKKLKEFKNIFRIRIGDYRIVYKRDKNQIYIILIGHRKEVYHLINRTLK